VLRENISVWKSCCTVCKGFFVGLNQIWAPALANRESGHFSEIQPSPALAKFLPDLADASTAAVCLVNYG